MFVRLYIGAVREYIDGHGSAREMAARHLH